MGVREQVAAAVDDLEHPELVGRVWPPVVHLPGLVWAQWSGSDTVQYASGAAVPDRDDWSVLCLLPAGLPETTGDALDRWRPLLLAALSPLGRLGRQSAVGVVLGEGGTAVPALQIQLLT